MWQTAAVIVIVALAAMAAILYIRRMVQGRSTGCGCGQGSCQGGGNGNNNTPVIGDCHCGLNTSETCGPGACSDLCRLKGDM